MIPILFEHDATDFTGKGLGEIMDTIECVVSASDDSTYELELQYPMNGPMVSELKPNRIIVAKANYAQPNQAFRIYGYSKNIEGMLTVKAQHISYDLNQVIFHPYRLSYREYQGRCTAWPYHYPSDLLRDLKNTSYLLTGQHPFTFYQYYAAGNRDIPYDAKVLIEEPTTARNALFGSSNSLISEFGGACIFDNYTLSFSPNPGTTRNIHIDYGVDLINLEQEENIAEMYTGILPYYIGKDRAYDGQSWSGPQSVVIGDIVYANGTFERQNILPLNISDDAAFKNHDIIDADVWDNVDVGQDFIPTADVVTRAGAQIMSFSNKYGVPEINMTVDYAHLTDNVMLFDIISVRFIKFGIDVQARINGIKYDSLNERIREVELGKTKRSGLWYNWDSEYKKHMY